MSAVTTQSAQPSQQRSWLADREPAVLVLEDGRTFRGESYGAVGETVGEAVGELAGNTVGKLAG